MLHFLFCNEYLRYILNCYMMLPLCYYWKSHSTLVLPSIPYHRHQNLLRYSNWYLNFF